jgi:hypothetical protein
MFMRVHFLILLRFGLKVWMDEFGFILLKLVMQRTGDFIDFPADIARQVRRSFLYPSAMN